MNNNFDNNGLVAIKNVVREIAKNEIRNSNLPTYIAAIVQNVNEDGTVNVFIPPNRSNTITNILNKTGERLKSGDSVEIATKNGSLTNCWISIKHGISDIDNAQGQLDDLKREIEKILNKQLLLKVYPIGSIYMSLDSTSPELLFGGTWQSVGEGRTLVGVGTGIDSNSVSKTFSVNDTGGLYNAIVPYHNHTTVNAAAHNHSVNITSGGAGKHSHKFGADHDCYCITSGTRGYSVHSAGITGADTTKNTNEVANHTHSVSGNTGDSGGHGHTINYAGTSGNDAGANLQPYIVVYMWKRTA